MKFNGPPKKIKGMYLKSLGLELDLDLRFRFGVGECGNQHQITDVIYGIDFILYVFTILPLTNKQQPE